MIPSVALLEKKAGRLPGCGCSGGIVSAVRGWGHGCRDCAEIVIIFLRATWPDVGMPLPDQKIQTPSTFD